MAIEILMPALSPTMTEGKLAGWLVKEGDAVTSGDIIAEIETDKATMEVEAVDDGTVAQLVVAEGTDNVAVNSVIAVLAEEGEDASTLQVSARAPTPKPAPKPAPKQAPKAETKPKTDSPSVTTAKAPESTPNSDGARLKASPLAKRLAADAGLDLATIAGSGPGGRIVKADVEAVKSGAVKPQQLRNLQPVSGGPSVSEGPNAAAIAEALGLEHEVRSVSKMRETIARRLTESKQTVPHFYLTVDINLDPLLATRKQINTAQQAADLPKISINDFLIKASAKALMQEPDANASWGGDGTTVHYKAAHISVAVAIDGGLITPVVRNADTKPITVISEEMRDLASRAREGKLRPDEYQGGTMSISNLGMFGIKEFSAVINPPEGMILAVGMGDKRPVVQDDGTLGVATMMSVTLSCDHRVVDGAIGAQWIGKFKNLVENPLAMLV